MAEFNALVRVANTDIDGNKKIVDGLRKVRGVSFMFANAMCKAAGVDINKKAGSLSEAELKKLQAVLEQPNDAGLPEWLLNRRRDYETGENKHIIVNDLRFTQDNDIKRMSKTKSYKGLRHHAKLPVRGQRTKSNYRPNKGKRK